MRRLGKLSVLIALCLLFLASPFLLKYLVGIPVTVSATTWVEDSIGAGGDNAAGGGSNLEGFFGRTMAIGPQWAVKWLGGDVQGLTTLSANPETLRQSAQNSVVGGLARAINTLYIYPPASTYAFLRDAGISLGFIAKPANAQGVGFAGLAPILPLWKAFRNVAYFLMAIVMVVIGFMVMFRKKIDPKTVVTVQNALPRVVITLLLITFSYAIVGIMIDVMYLLILLVIGIIAQSNLLPASAAEFPTKFTTGNFWDLLKIVFDLGTAGGFQVTGLSGLGAGLIGTGTAGGVIAAALSLFGAVTLGTGGTALVAAPIVIAIVIVLFLIVLLFALFRIFFMLLMAYVNIIIALIFGPIQIMFDAIPGGNGFSGWIRNLAANMLVFPATALTLTLAAVMVNLSSTSAMWAPPFLNFINLPNTQASAGLPGILTLGLLLITPTLANAMKEALKPPEFKGAGAPAAAIGAVFGFPVSFGTGMAQSAISSYMMRKNLNVKPSQPDSTQKTPGSK